MQKEYYRFKNGMFCPISKDEIAKTIKIFEYDTVLPWCKYFDIPFIQKVWERRIRIQLENNLDVSPRTIFSKYYGTMKLPNYIRFTFEDTKRFIET